MIDGPIFCNTVPTSSSVPYPQGTLSFSGMPKVRFPCDYLVHYRTMNM